MAVVSLLVSGLIGVLGIVIAILQFQDRRRLSKLEIEKHLTEVTRERQTHAGQVACWVASTASSEKEGRKAVVHLINGGPQPIFQVHVLIRPYYQSYEPTTASQIGGHFVGSLGPGAQLSWDHEIRADQQEVFLASGSLPTEVAFLDVGRRQWRRTVQGELEELGDLLGGFC